MLLRICGPSSAADNDPHSLAASVIKSLRRPVSRTRQRPAAMQAKHTKQTHCAPTVFPCWQQSVHICCTLTSSDSSPNAYHLPRTCHDGITNCSYLQTLYHGTLQAMRGAVGKAAEA
eukprot:GHVU01137828.1.p2 GENE.GHVU01137828.1~~GHVU01137828.1.p2  ORF type:complete len:117 (+),score=6.44 GHVU01137828.1:299-649(+)